MKRVLYLFGLLLITFHLVGQEAKDSTIDDLIQSLSVEEKIGQVFMIRAFSKDDNSHINDVKDQIKKYHIGGICFFQGTPSKQAKLVNEYQELSSLPLMISIDGEWGMGMRFPEDAISFPRQLTIGAINDHQLIYLMGKEIARQCKKTGVYVNFAPVVDVNNNSDNPVINTRSFGEDRYNVAAKSYAYMKGLQDEGVMACAKHFPGHGDTAVDSHYDLPIINHTRRRLDSIELFPFEMLIRQGVQGVMVAHLQVPALDDRQNRPTTVSNNVVEKLLQDEMNFDGLIFTDAMEMKGVTKHFPPGEAEVEAFLAGNDVILLPANIEKAISAFKRALDKGTIDQERLDKSVRKILEAKYDLGLLDNLEEAEEENIEFSLNSIQAHKLKSRIYEKALTLVANEEQILPIEDLSQTQFGSVSLGASSITPFQKRMHSYVNVSHFQLPKDASDEQYKRTLERLSKKETVFVSTHKMSQYSKRNFGIDERQINFIHDLSERTNVLLIIFGSPYSLRYFENVKNIMVAYEEDKMAQEAAAQAIFGAIDITGKLPVSASDLFEVNSGINLPSLNRIGYALPEAVGLNSDSLGKIDELVSELIDDEAAPGCQVLVAKNNKIVYHKAFGYHTYDKKTKVQLNDLYDVASITKVLASTISIMHLQDQGYFDLKNPVVRYVPQEDTTNKASLLYEDMLAHVSGLAGWIPFYANTLDQELDNKPSMRYYRPSPEPGFDIMVTPNMYLRSDYRDTIWRKVFSSSLRENNNYRYSDLAFYILNKTIENISGYQVDAYAEINFYRPMGLRRTMFNPYRIFDRSLIAPSEHDEYWRNEVVQGTVHDMGAAMLGGVSGHAGLFSTSQELAILMQMLLNGGYYGGRQFLKPSTIRYYTQRHWRSSRRGIGFDMKELDEERTLNMSEKASRHTFGHLGFTGTAAFADPDHDIIYVFLSNRTFPTMKNNKLGKEDYRPRIQSVIYDALMTE